MPVSLQAQTNARVAPLDCWWCGGLRVETANDGCHTELTLRGSQPGGLFSSTQDRRLRVPAAYL